MRVSGACVCLPRQRGWWADRARASGAAPPALAAGPPHRPVLSPPAPWHCCPACATALSAASPAALLAVWATPTQQMGVRGIGPCLDFMRQQSSGKVQASGSSSCHVSIICVGTEPHPCLLLWLLLIPQLADAHLLQLCALHILAPLELVLRALALLRDGRSQRVHGAQADAMTGCHPSCSLFGSRNLLSNEAGGKITNVSDCAWLQRLEQRCCRQEGRWWSGSEHFTVQARYVLLTEWWTGGGTSSYNCTVMFALQVFSCKRSMSKHHMTDSRCTSNLLPSCICCWKAWESGSCMHQEGGCPGAVVGTTCP